MYLYYLSNMLNYHKKYRDMEKLKTLKQRWLFRADNQKRKDQNVWNGVQAGEWVNWSGAILIKVFHKHSVEDWRLATLWFACI